VDRVLRERQQVLFPPAVGLQSTLRAPAGSRAVMQPPKGFSGFFMLILDFPILFYCSFFCADTTKLSDVQILNMLRVQSRVGPSTAA